MFIAGLALVIIGILCCFIHKVPGPLVALIGVLLVKLTEGVGELISWGTFAICAALVIGSMIAIHYLVPALKSKLPEHGKAGTWGTFLGSVIAIIIAAKGSLVVGIITILVVPYVLALLFETIASKGFATGSKRALGSYGIFLATTVIKLIVCMVMLNIVISANNPLA